MPSQFRRRCRVGPHPSAHVQLGLVVSRPLCPSPHPVEPEAQAGLVSDGTVCGQHTRPILGPALAVLAHTVAARESSELHLKWKWG